jgi:hypothetical protein
MNSSLRGPEAPVNLDRLVLSTILVVSSADFLLWEVTPGCSIVLWLMMVVGLLAWNRSQFWSQAKLPLLLFGGALVQSVLAFNFSNTLVLLVLLLVLIGGTFYHALPSGWPRWSEAAWAQIKAPARWGWLAGEIIFHPLRTGKNVRGSILAVWSWGGLLLPAFGLGLAFLFLLSSGNAILGDWFHLTLHHLWTWLWSFNLSIERILFWSLVATMALAFFRPAPAPVSARWWTHQFSRYPLSALPARDTIRSLAILAVVNVVFFVTNIIDVFYLWAQARLPAEVSPSQFLHQGTAQLIVAIVLAALVLVVLFYQHPTVTRSTGLRLLANGWILQNLFLVGGVFLRLKLYVEEYQLSYLRVGVALFLLLVSVGLGLLALYVAGRLSLNQLVWRNALATFVLFYLLQFGDVGGWIARYNVAQWLRQPERSLDIDYLYYRIGPSAWPSLTLVATHHLGSPAQREALARIWCQPGERSSDWRSWQLRRAWQEQEQLDAKLPRPENP